MATFNTSGLNDLIADMRRMDAMTEPVAVQMCMGAAEAVKQAWQQAIQENDLIDYGDMMDSIGYAQQPTKFGDVLGIDIYPQGKDRHGVRNAEKAFILNYGNQLIDPTYFVDRADALSAETVPPLLEKIWQDYLDTGYIRPLSDYITPAPPHAKKKRKEGYKKRKNWKRTR